MRLKNTLLSELVQRVPGRILTTDEGANLKLQSMVVACDLGPTLVTRLLDTESETFVWSKTYNLDEFARDVDGPAPGSTGSNGYRRRGGSQLNSATCRTPSH